MYNFKMVQIKSADQVEPDYLWLNNDLAKTISLPEDNHIELHVGQLKRIFKVVISNKTKNNQILLHPTIMKQLYLTAEHNYGIKIINNVIYLGPVVGIMADIYNENGKLFGGQTLFIQQLLAAGREIGELCFAFSPHSINWNRNTITGYTYVKNAWKKAVFPLPDVVYQRTRGFSPVKMSIRQKLSTQGVKLFNPILVGKWNTYKILSQNQNLANYLPDTRLFNKFSLIDTMTRNYQAVYLKPVNGSQGRNIIRVERHKNRGYHYQFEVNKQTVNGNAHSLEQLQAVLKPVIGNRTYIIQREIKLLKEKGRIVDLRILVQKDHTGEWAITGIAGRVGKEGSITTNISAGGNGCRLDKLLSSNFADSQQQQNIETLVEYIALESAKSLEAGIGLSGEMGVDIGIDRWGKPWFIEANLRPARYIFNLLNDRATRLKSVERPMLYCRFLSSY